MSDEIKVEVALMKNDIGHIKTDISDMKKTLEKLDGRFVKIERYAIIEKVVLGVSMSVILGVVGLLLKSGVLNV